MNWATGGVNDVFHSLKVYTRCRIDPDNVKFVENVHFPPTHFSRQAVDYQRNFQLYVVSKQHIMSPLL